MEKTLNFSEPFISIEHVAFEEDHEIDQKSIIVNIDLDPLHIDDIELPSLKSIICDNTFVPKATSMLVITIADEDFIGKNTAIEKDIITNNWHHVFDLFNAPHLEKTPLWSSQKERIGNLEFNLWYAPAKTNCGIHNQHNFQEVHSQLYGLGRMQKFHRNDFSALFQEVFMSPGFTHDPFYSNTGQYPWHQYYADTDCIWLAIEKH